jgi:hypothetical protein
MHLRYNFTYHLIVGWIVWHFIGGMVFCVALLVTLILFIIRWILFMHCCKCFGVSETCYFVFPFNQPLHHLKTHTENKHLFYCTDYVTVTI